MDTNGFGMNSYHTVFVNVTITAVRLKMKIRLTWTVRFDFNLLWIRNAVPVNIRTLDTVCLKECVRNTGMNLCRIRCDGIHCIHICRKLFDLNFNCFCCCPCMLFCISSYDGNRITKLEDFFIAKYRTFETVCLVVFWKHYKTIDLIGSACCLNIFCCDNTNNTRHTLCFCCVNIENICMRNLCLCKSKAKCSWWHL